MSAIDLGAFIVLAVFLRAPMGHVGISVAVAGSELRPDGALARGAAPPLPRAIGSEAERCSGRCSVRSWPPPWRRSLAEGAARGASSVALPPALAGALPGIAGAGVFALVFVAAARAMGSPELEEIRRAWHSRQPRRKEAR